MTEDEARTKWCPFSTTGAYTDRGPMGAVAVNRDPRPEVADACLCLASGCMAWRWIFANQSKHEGGYCGLAEPRTSTVRVERTNPRGDL